MSELKKNVVLVVFQYSVVVKGFEKKLRDLAYGVDVLSEGYNSISGRVDWAGLVVFYLPKDIVSDLTIQDNFKKMLAVVQEKGRNIIIVGEPDFHGKLLSDVPSVRDCKWFDRPVDMDAFAQAVEKGLQAPAKKTGEKKILIVDDDPSYAGMVREWIKDTYHTDIVTAGMQAITFLLKKPVDLILLDYEMPVVDGPQVLQMLRQEEATAHIPVIFLTGNGTKEAVGRVMALKPDGYILKSTSRDKLLELLKNKLG
ncbi:MAG: response regulator [Lachnospiraceae bacterium]|nr:response regulator [Lachnospiraceae bacterium]